MKTRSLKMKIGIIEYDFNEHGVPIQVGLDARPMWRFIGYNGGGANEVALSVRFTF